MSELRIVRGNTFYTRSQVVAKTYDGQVIQDFDLALATDIVVMARTDYRNVAMVSWEINGNNLDVLWRALPCGRYGLDVSGIYNGLEWRFYNAFVLAIVESNDLANIPQDCIIREDFYSLDATTLVMTAVEGGGGNVQSDWEETDDTKASYIKNKPTIPSVIPVVYHTAPNERFTIPSNEFHVWNNAGNLILSLGTPQEGIYNEYMFEISNCTSLSLPSSIKWATPLNLSSSKTYQVSIVDNIAIIVGV